MPHPSQAQSSMLKLGWLYYQYKPPPPPPSSPIWTKGSQVRPGASKAARDFKFDTKNLGQTQSTRISDYRFFQILDFRFRFSDFRFWICSDFRFQIYNLGFQIEFRISDLGFQILDFSFRISDFGFQIFSDFRFQIF